MIDTVRSFKHLESTLERNQLFEEERQSIEAAEPSQTAIKAHSTAAVDLYHRKDYLSGGGIVDYRSKGYIARCNSCGTIDVDIRFRSPESVTAQLCHLTPIKLRGKAWNHAPRCPACFSSDIDTDYRKTRKLRYAPESEQNREEDVEGFKAKRGPHGGLVFTHGDDSLVIEEEDDWFKLGDDKQKLAKTPHTLEKISPTETASTGR